MDVILPPLTVAARCGPWDSATVRRTPVPLVDNDSRFVHSRVMSESEVVQIKGRL